jgi:hypothetical protein
MYLVYVIGGGELKIDFVNIEAIFKSPTLTNFTEVRIFVGVAQYIWMFITFLLAIVATPLHAITTS